MSQFSRFAKTPKCRILAARGAKTAVIYTRVSSKEQADKNLSLEFQRKSIEEYAGRNGFRITASSGGTYESAKTDGRKEFTRMLDHVKKSKGSVSHILVYTLDRFSRTGGGAIKLAEELREKYGVMVFAVTQPVDTSNPSGVFQQNVHFIFSQYDNGLRKQRAVAGMKEKFNQGIWCVKPPMGYDVVWTNGVRKIVVNATGKKLRKAFEWKLNGEKNEAILARLRAMGVNIYKQKLAAILANPFYCGLLCHGMLEGRVIEGTHEKLISKDLFLRVNNLEKPAHYGVPHLKERDEVPLKVFVRCADCDEPFTGYVVKAKSLWYYKCRTKGCKCNKSAKEMHRIFEKLLAEYTLQEHLREPLQYELEASYDELNREAIDLQSSLRQRLEEIQKKVENIEEKYYVEGEMSRETFEKFAARFRDEAVSITRELERGVQTISNHSEAIANALEFSSKLAPVWTSSDVRGKERLQKLVFPDGLVFDKQTSTFRTGRVNIIFAAIASAARISAQKEKGQTGLNSGLSFSVGSTDQKSNLLMKLFETLWMLKATT